MPKRRMPIGSELDDGGASFRVWAPTHSRVALVIDGLDDVALEPAAGYHVGFVRGVEAGARYRFRVAGALLADPAARFLPEGPFGPAEIIDPSRFAWTDAAWRGIPPAKHVLYEMHVGTFTPEGTWAAAQTWLPFFADLGITTIEMMPINAFAGRYNWGYDGVNLFAPNHTYGRPDDLRRFVDRAHGCGLAVILDVVYNHFGPSGNSLFTWNPAAKHAELTEWGEALDFAEPGLRELVIENAGYWVREYHFDGLRLDATQTIRDPSPEHVITALTRRAREAGGERTIFVCAENETQTTALLDGGVDALWNDDFHHSARVAMTGLIEGYLHDYRGTPQELISAVKRGFLYQGQLYPWQRNPRGSPALGRSRASFVQFLDNHDQAANLGGERLVTTVDPATLRAMTALLLLSPALPMLFQGQETGARQPWLFFVDHTPDLHEPIRAGRAKFEAQFARLATPESQAALHDPNLATTFRRCILDPAERHADNPMVMLHRDLLRLRRDDPAFTDPRLDAMDGAVLSDHAFVLRFFQPDGDRLLLVNLGPTLALTSVAEPLIAPLGGQGWRVQWSSEDPRYGGHGTPEPFTRTRLALPARSAIVVVPDAASLRVDPPPSSGDDVRAEP
jgi:maltooligosyltrehalose trehalohydrolase